MATIRRPPAALPWRTSHYPVEIDACGLGQLLEGLLEADGDIGAHCRRGLSPAEQGFALNVDGQHLRVGAAEVQ
jgi:hypothetical protein